MFESILYVMTAPYFWQTMAMTTACSVWIGAMLYNGDLRLLAKGLVMLLPYVSLLLLTNYVRISDRLGSMAVDITSNQLTTAYAGIVTIGFLTVFYVFGLVLGVFITKKAHHYKH